MKSAYWSTVVFVVSSLALASFGDGPSLDELVQSPEKFKGQTLLFERVMLSGDFINGKARYRLTVKTPAGKLVDGEPHPEGIAFTTSFTYGDEIKPLLKKGQFHPVRLTCTVKGPGKKGNADKWVADVSKIEPIRAEQKSEPELTGKWSGKYDSGLLAGSPTSMDLRDLKDGKFNGTWDDSTDVRGVRTGARMVFSVTWKHPKVGLVTTSASGDISNDGKTLTINFIASWKVDNRVETDKGVATLKREETVTKVDNAKKQAKAKKENATADKLLSQLNDDDEIIRLSAVKQLAKLGSAARNALPDLEKVAANDNDDDVRRTAKEAIQKIRDAIRGSKIERIPELLAQLNSKNKDTKLTAIAELRIIGPDARLATRGLCQAILDADPKVKERASDALEIIDPFIHKHATTLLVDKSPHEHRQALFALEKRGSDATAIMPVLQNRYDFYSTKRDFTWKGVSIHALSVMASIDATDKKVISYTLEALNDKQMVFGAIRLIDKQNPKDYVPALIQLLDNNNVRLIAIDVLGGFGRDARDAIPQLTQLKKDGQRNVREAATAALAKIQAR